MASGLFLDSIEAAKLVFGVEIYGIEGMGAMIQRLPNAALSKSFLSNSHWTASPMDLAQWWTGFLKSLTEKLWIQWLNCFFSSQP